MNKLEQEATDYLGKHRIDELFNHVGASLALYMPEDLEAFLLGELIRRKNEGAECGMCDETPHFVSIHRTV